MNDFQRPESPEAPPTPTGPEGPRRLHRSSQQRMLMGVCGGLAEYFDVDPTIVRIVFALLTVFGGSGIVIYVVLAIIMPSEEAIDEHPRDAAKATVDEAVQESRRAVGRATGWVRDKAGRSKPSDGDANSA